MFLSAYRPVFIDASPAGYREIHTLTSTIPDKGVANVFRPSIADGRLYVRNSAGDIICLDAKGTPCVTERAWVLAPGSRIGPATEDERKQLIASSLVAGTYEKTVDRESA